MFGPTARLLKVLGLMALTLGFYFIARFEFLIWNWSLFKNKEAADIVWAFVVGLRFDLSSIFVLSAPLLVWTFIPWPASFQRFWTLTTAAFYCILHVPFLVLNLVDNEFINFVGRRFTFDSLFIVNEVPGKIWNFFISYWHLFSINAVITFSFVAAVIFWVRRVEPGLTWHPASRLKAWLRFSGLCFLSICCAVIAIRGGVQNKPISFVSATVFPAPLLNNLVLNSTFTFVRSYGAQSLKREVFFADEKEMLRHLNGSLPGSNLEGRRPKQKPNIFLIVLESFGAEFVGPNDQGQSYTPFLDDLKKRSLSFTHAYANGRRSIEGIGALLAGIPALMNEPFISSHFTTNYFVGLGTLLSQNGYQTSFFHGGHNGTMFFDSFMASAGVEKYYGAKEYANPQDDDGVWGIWDRPFLQWMVGQLQTAPPPFMTTVFTLTSHQPYKVPAAVQDQYPEGPLPILKTIAYTDDALKAFFESAQKQSWYQNSIFILTADHAALHYREQFDNDLGNYQIPFIIYSPGIALPPVDLQQQVQQIDVLPTILDILGQKATEKNYLGSSIFTPGEKVVVNFIDGRYLLFAKNYWMRWTPDHGDAQLFAIADRKGEQNLTGPEHQTQKDGLFLKLKAHIQYFNTGMWDNKLYYPSR